MSPDADNFLSRSGSHHVALGRWIGSKTAEFYNASQPRDKGGRWSRMGGRGFAPHASGASGRDQYRKLNGITHFAAPKSFENVVVSPQDRARAARAYARMPISDPAAVPAYRALRGEVREQFNYLTKTLGIKVVVTKTDPYPDVESMMRDINENGRLKVMSTATTGGHPFFTDRENDMFRAVHDYFGHAATGRDFSRHGERAAYLSHVSMMKSKDSIRALFTETEMQNAALIATGSFQDQKVALAPDSMVFAGLTGNASFVTVSADVFACYSKACAPPPVGKGGSADIGTQGKALTRNAAEALREPDGGFTLRASDGGTITSGYAVALKGSDKLISAKALFDAKGQPSKGFQDLVQDRTAALQKALPSLPKGVQHALGGWHNPDDGKAEVNISVVFPPTRQADATKFAQSNDQISMARLHDPFEIISTGGTGGDRS